MLYAVNPPAQADRILLYPSERAARSCTGHGRPIYAVAVRFEVRHRCITPLLPRPDVVDPTWFAPAEQHADGTITAKGPIPEVFCAQCPPALPAREVSSA
jgi:hypothetical protein